MKERSRFLALAGLIILCCSRPADNPLGWLVVIAMVIGGTYGVVVLYREVRDYLDELINKW